MGDVVCSECKRPNGKRGQECRPYGKGGAWICYDCAMKPTNRPETDRQFSRQLDAATSEEPAVLTPHGPKKARTAIVQCKAELERMRLRYEECAQSKPPCPRCGGSGRWHPAGGVETRCPECSKPPCKRCGGLGREWCGSHGPDSNLWVTSPECQP